MREMMWKSQMKAIRGRPSQADSMLMTSFELVIAACRDSVSQIRAQGRNQVRWNDATPSAAQHQHQKHERILEGFIVQGSSLSSTAGVCY